MKSENKNQRGMTLLEVIIALAIFSISALALLNSMSSQMNAMSHFRENLFASWIADNALAQMSLTMNAAADSVDPTKADMAGQTWFVQQRDSKDEENDLILRRVEVRAQEDDRNALLTFSTRIPLAEKENHEKAQ